MRTNTPAILVVDDDPNDLLFIKTAFKAAGVITQVQTVNSGQEALAYLDGEGPYANRDLYPYPDLILTDLNMPGIDGFGVLEFLRKRPAFAVIPTIVMSGSQDSDDIKRAYWLGASAFHVKPSSPTELRHLVKTLHAYWSLSEAPERDAAGEQLDTESFHKLGARFVGEKETSRREESL